MKKLLIGLGAVLLVSALIAVWVWNDRPSMAKAGIDLAPPAPSGAELTVTWYGVSTLLFDDGDTQLLIDGFFSRPGLLDMLGEIGSDIETIDEMIADADLTRLAAVITVHSHFDHAMDTGEVAKRTDAVVFGSASTANIARGAGVAEERIIEVDDFATRKFGAFTVTQIRSRHAPIADGGPPIPGEITTPLRQPAAATNWKEGGSYSIVIAHPDGTTVVQGSAGYLEDSLEGLSADTVMLGVGGLGILGPEYARTYWREIVGRTGARRVALVHWDDFFQPLGTIVPVPTVIDDLAYVEWLKALAGETVSIEILPYGQPVSIAR